ncbi:MAG: winged helix DNA-binding protein [Candidatus Caldarchaeum sp.]
MEALTAVFTILFMTQTAVFIFLYRRASANRDITHGKENHVASQQPRRTLQPPSNHETAGKSDEMPMLHDSALAALRLIREKGSVISSDVSRSLNLSREHAARVMKNLYEMGLVARSGKPFKYSLTEKGLAIVASEEAENDSPATTNTLGTAPNPASNKG